MSNIHLQNDVFYPHRTNIISELVRGKRVPGPIWHKRDYRLKFLLRSLLFWSSTHRMLEALSGRDDFDRLLTSQITLPSKTHRQYLMRGLNSNDRADAIISHYQWIDSLKNIALAHALTSPQEVPVVRFEAKNGEIYTVHASSAGKAEREGESTLWLHDNDNTLLASLTFCVARSNGRTSAIFAVSDEGHVFRALRYRLSKGRHFHASYDEFWEGLNGKKLSPFCWQLPLQMERKALEEIASKKRAEYRRRFALLDDIAASVHARIGPAVVSTGLTPAGLWYV
ncbi:MAG: VirK/YbjX family protein [Enterobacter hormaechei]|nr:VirK/YbjX family protein [Enterobacter hormaechei]